MLTAPFFVHGVLYALQFVGKRGDGEARGRFFCYHESEAGEPSPCFSPCFGGKLTLQISFCGVYNVIDF